MRAEIRELILDSLTAVDMLAAATAIVNEITPEDAKGASVVAKALQAAREILHYAEQLRNADNAQWQASFQFELNNSTSTLKKQAKRILFQEKRSAS